MKITSLQNPGLKAAVKLRERKERASTKTFLVEGCREISRALSASYKVVRTFYCPAFFTPEAARLHEALSSQATQARPCIELDEKCFNKLVVRQDNEGLVVVFAAREHTLSSLQLSANPLLIAMEGVEKPGNLGALLRSADGAGADAVVVLEGSVDPYHPQVIRASLGTVFSLPVVSCRNAQFLAFAQAQGLKIVSALLDPQSKPYHQHDLAGPIALLLGTEASGLSAYWQGQSEGFAYIPMHGLADSLNVSVAGAVLLYEARRQRVSR